MEQIALMIGNTYLYWSSIIRVLAVAAFICCIWALFLQEGGEVLALAVGTPLALALSLVLARAAHWYFLPGNYASLQAALQPAQPGGFALAGAFAGCFLAAGIVRVLGLTKNLPDLLDCLCIAGCLGIALGRLGAWFGSSDRGMIIAAEGWYPWVSGVRNQVSGAEEPRLAVFLIQAVAAAALFISLLIWYLAGKERRRSGDGAMLFLLCYGASQVLLDSVRYDALHFRSNGFISVVQVLCAVAMAFVVVVMAVRLHRTRGWRPCNGLLWLLQAGCFGLAGYMEYYVQRHGGQAIMAYSIMGAALTAIVLLTLWSRYQAEKTGMGREVW